MTDTSGYDKAKEVVEKLKGEKEKVMAEQKQLTELALSQMVQIKQSSELSKMYTESALIGADNLAGELPILKVHSAGKSTKNELVDGTEPKDGAFFYKPTKEQYDGVTCHILTISRGFRASGIDNKIIFNQVVGGVIIDAGAMKPFVMYMTGLKLKPLWEFGKVVSGYTRMKPIPVPMFALTVKMTTEKVTNNYGKSWIIKFEVVKTEDGSPVLVMDPAEFQFLKDHVEVVEDTIASIITAKTLPESGDDQTPASSSTTGEEIPF